MNSNLNLKTTCEEAPPFISSCANVAAQENKTPLRTESQIEKDITEVEEHQHGLQTQSILNPGGRAIPPLTQTSRRELLTPSPLPSLTNPPPTETPEEHLKTRRTLTPLSITTGLGEIRSEEETSPSTPKKPELDISNISLTSAEESDPFQHLLHTLKNSPRSTKQPQIEEMSEDKRPLGSRPKVEPIVEEAVIGTTVLVQIVAAEKEVKVALPRAFTGHRKDVKKFLREVQLYIALNPKTFTMDQTKKLFFLSYMTDGLGEFWKNNKTDLLLTFDPEAEKVSWIDFMEAFKTSFKPLDTTLEAQLKL
uniref:Retrotransposon gag domain-containing protein n=1 Tax=Moniliophthora roreri TaxID=221103 RepID=A0A0W0G1I6_MONRR